MTMGLDITAYRQLQPSPGEPLDADGEPVDWKNVFFPGTSMEWSEREFPGRAEGIQLRMPYQFAEKYRHGGHSYSGYNKWRNLLAVFAGYTSAEDCWKNHVSGPFFELINFFDNEGVIGPVVSGKLLADFQKNRERLRTWSDPDRSYLESRYDEWTKVFEFGADGGAVRFH